MTPRWTAIFVAAILPILGLIDLLIAITAGNAATFSAVLLAIRVKYPLVALSIGYAFGVFLGHVFFPSADPVPPSNVEVLARMITGLSPLFSAILVLATGDGKMPALSRHVTDPSSQATFAGLMLLAITIGGVVGRFVLAQHPLAVLNQNPIGEGP